MLVCFNCILKLLSSLFIILPFLFTGANCEESSSRWTLYPVCSNGLWGYIDQQGELVLPYQWSYCGDFRGNGYALVCTKSGQYGIISSTGDYMIYPIPFADEAEELGYYGGKDTGVYWLDNGQNMGFFDVQSGFFSGYRYDLTQDLWFDAECSRLLRITYDGETYGYVSRQNGVQQIPCIFEQINTTGFHNGFAFENLASSEELVIVRENGTFLSIPDNLSVEGTSFENHLLLVQDKETKLYGYCDSEGYCAIIPQFEDANSFQNSYAPISQSGKWSHIDLNGNVCSPAVFDSPYYFESERAIAMKNGSPVLIDASGDTLKILDSELTYYDFLPEGIALFSSRFYTGLIDIEGNELLPLSEGMYIDPYPTDGHFFSEGKHPVMNDEGKWGYIDLSGQIVIECKWNRVCPFNNGLARVYLDDKMALIDHFGTIIWEEGGEEQM